MNTSHQSIEIKEKKPDNLTHSLIESDFFTCIPFLGEQLAALSLASVIWPESDMTAHCGGFCFLGGKKIK